MRSRSLPAVLFMVLLSCSGGDGGSGSPTAPPPPILRVAGTWEGIWVPPITVSLRLNQPEGSRIVTGTISAVGFTLALRGETTFVSAGTGTFNWEVTESGCGTWTGTMQVTAPDSMNGPSRFSTLGCSNPDVIDGRMFLSRVGGAGLVAGDSAATLEDLVRELHEMP